MFVRQIQNIILIMINKHVIALNRLLLAQEQLLKRDKSISRITNEEVNQIMNFMGKYPQQKIRHERLFTCGFSKN